MPDTKGIRVTGKDIMFVIAIAGMIVGFFVKIEVLKNTVERHEALLNQYNIPVMNEQMKNVAEDVSEVKDIVKMLSDHILTQ